MFVLVAEHGSFRMAAEAAHRSQSAASMQVSQLEAQLGIKLFHRTTRWVRLTHEGERLLQSARLAHAALEAAVRDLTNAADLQKGRLSISCVPSVASTRLPGVLAAFQKEFPGIAVHVRELPSVALMKSVQRQEVDFGIGPEIDGAAAFNFKCILVDPVYALIPMRHEATSKSGIALRQLADFPVLMLTRATALRSDIERALESAKVAFAIKHEVTAHHTAIAMAAAGLGIAILPRIAMPARGYGNLKAVPLVNPSLSRKISIITLRGHAWSPAATRLAEMLQRLISKRSIDSVLPRPG